MAKKSVVAKQQVSNTATSSKSSVQVVAAAAPAAAGSVEKKPRAPRAPKVKPVVAASVVPTSAAAAPAPAVATSPAPRRVTTRETVLEDFDNLLGRIQAELTRARDAGEKTVSFKFTRYVSRQISQLKTHSQKVMKKRRVANPEKTHNSIFQMAVPISEELAHFNGWNPSELHSRVEVTRALCQYIKDNNLQDPNDRRIILVDDKLSKLLKYTPGNGVAPLNYSRLQSFMKVHFPATAGVKPDAVVRPASSPKRSKTVAARK